MVQVAQELARRFETPQNQLQIFKMSAETLEFPADNFDLVFGSNVLHHCNLDTVSREIARVLKPGGRAVFIEPLGYNPIIELYRRMAFKVRTPTEHPLVYRDIQTIAENFKSVSHKEFHFLTLAIFLWFFIGEGIHPNEARYWRKFVLESNRYARAFRKLHALDNFLLDNFPLLKRLCWVIVATFDK
jgi:SAM-dependent methyltransferase